jgi:hypothetical protein
MILASVAVLTCDVVAGRKIITGILPRWRGFIVWYDTPLKPSDM